MTFEAGAKSVTLPPGVYVIGDPCYFVPDEEWDRVLEESDFFEGQCHAKFKRPDGDGDGDVVAFSTAYGDGVYTDLQRREYGVDAGLIGIALKNDVGGVPDGCHEVVFKSPFLCCSNRGVIEFGINVTINTDDDDDDGDCDEDFGDLDSQF